MQLPYVGRVIGSSMGSVGRAGHGPVPGFPAVSFVALPWLPVYPLHMLFLLHVPPQAFLFRLLLMLGPLLCEYVPSICCLL